jgi:hypothetical protein
MMDELSDRARAYLDAFAKEHRAPAMVPPLRPLTAVKAASWLRWLVPTVGMAAVVAAGWSAGRAGTIEIAAAKRFEAAPHHATVPAIEDAPTVALRSTSLRAREDVAVVEAAPVRPRVRPPSSTLRQELAMLDAAKASLRAGDRDAALRALTRHADRFPNGLLAPERRRLTIRIDEQTEPTGCVHSSCVGSDDHQEPTR